MTAPSTNKTPAKSSPAKVANATPEKTTDTDKVEVKQAETETPKDRIPEVLSENPIFAEFCKRYLDVVDEIAEYNKAVLAEKDAEWNTTKVLAKAKEFASPEDATKANPEIKKIYDEWEKALSAASALRKSVIDATAKELGVNLSAVAERDLNAEAPLKENRKRANEIGTQLSNIAKMTTNAPAEKAIEEFLANNPLPAVGRDQARTFGTEGSTTPKYRVNVTVKKDGNVLLEESGFTKAALGLTKPAFGYERGKSLKSEDLRKAWERAGNSSEKTVKETVEFEDNGLTFILTKK